MCGLDNTYDLIKELILYRLYFNDIIENNHINLPHGILLYGPPGVGKTHVVRSVYNELSIKNQNIKLIVINGVDIYSPIVGESESKLKEIFISIDDLLRSNYFVICFIDEIDSLCPLRKNSSTYQNRITTQFLTFIDGFITKKNLIIIGATNRENDIDDAMRRGGRLDFEIYINPPSTDSKYQMLNVYFIIVYLIINSYF